MLRAGRRRECSGLAGGEDAQARQEDFFLLRLSVQMFSNTDENVRYLEPEKNKTPGWVR